MTNLVDAAKEQQHLRDVIEEIKNEDLAELYAVGKDKQGRFMFFVAGRIQGLGTAASVLTAEFTKAWNE